MRNETNLQTTENGQMAIPKFDPDYLPKGYVRNEIGCWEGLLARPGYFTLDPAAKAAICNGIGADSGFTRNFPDTIWGLDCKEAGDRHDYDYEIGGSPADKETADLVFLHNLRVLIRKGSWLLRPLRHHRAVAYYLALRLGGAKYYNYTAK